MAHRLGVIKLNVYKPVSLILVEQTNFLYLVLADTTVETIVEIIHSKP